VVGSASKRADGIAQRGKTKGRMVWYGFKNGRYFAFSRDDFR
jgi:hypothetical protein